MTRWLARLTIGAVGSVLVCGIAANVRNPVPPASAVTTSTVIGTAVTMTSPTTLPPYMHTTNVPDGRCHEDDPCWCEHHACVSCAVHPCDLPETK